MYFFELEGKQSKFGFHNFGYDEIDLYLIDVSPYGENYMAPEEFVNIFGDTNIARLLYVGELTDDFIQSVLDNKLNLKEGS